MRSISPQLVHLLNPGVSADKPVSDVAVIETPDVIFSVADGELVLSSTLFQNSTEQFVADSLARLSQANCAGLLIKNPPLNHITPALLRYAQQLNFPIYQVEPVISLSEIFKILYRNIRRVEQQDFECILSGLRHLNNLAISGASLEEIAVSMAQEISNTVLFLDLKFSIISIQTVLPNWHADTVHLAVGQRFFTPVERARIESGLHEFPTSPYLDRIIRNNEYLSFIIVPTRWGDSTTGYLCLLSTNKPFSMPELWTIENFLPILSQAMHSKMLTETPSLNVEDLFVWQVLLQQSPNMQRAKQVCALCGFDYNAVRICMVIEYPTLKTAPAAKRRSTLERQRIFIANQLETYTNTHKLILIHENYLIVLHTAFGDLPRISVIQDHEIFGKRLVEHIDSEFSLDCFIGLSETSRGLETLSECYFQAAESISLGKKIRLNQSWFSYHEQYLFHRLWRSFTSKQLHEICINILEPIMDDTPDFAELRRTLEVYISCNGNLSQTAERLFIHRNTLNYRMTKLKNLLSINEISADDFTRYMVGLTILKMI